ncbi:S-adenosyl-L-methionine-dependent methyltransferase [Quillaja saponaria]|uniref:S-adenosyl-L-methionine-dependent methyltransferase n=1 Tax=Quillaja saponaria TaxID=32244 RepID=A0AAD7QAU0_QUISA|nr:S-adenosyl-L-methionine-dependent methyltransferase [Quillaja saponaria]
MALSSSPKGVVITVPVLVLSVSVTAVFLFFLLSSLSSCSCPSPPPRSSSSKTPIADDVAVGGAVSRSGGSAPLSTKKEDVEWVKDQIRANGLQMHDNVLRKGINPRTRAQQLEDIRQFKGISHYEGPESENHTALPCPGELLVEEHHSNYGEPWAGGRDVFEFLAESAQLTQDSRVLEIGCGTL